MNKCIVLFLAFHFVFVHSCIYKQCINELEFGMFNENDTGIEAFTNGYYKLTLNNVIQLQKEYLIQYYRTLYDFATIDMNWFRFNSPGDWCYSNYANNPKCKDDVMDAGYRHKYPRGYREMNGHDAFFYSYYDTNQDDIRQTNEYALQYYQYLFITYKPKLDTKSLPNPKDFCNGIVLRRGPPSNYSDERRNREAGEGTSRQNFIPLNNDGQFIDLNKSYED